MYIRLYTCKVKINIIESVIKKKTLSYSLDNSLTWGSDSM